MKRVCLLSVLAVMWVPAAAQDDIAIAPRPAGVTKETREAIKRALDFLAREQNNDGSWRSGGGYGNYPVAMTGLAGLALCASGSTPVRGPYARHVRKAVNYCLSQQQPNGLMAAVAEESRSMYGHGFSMLFLSQVYGMEEDKARQRRIKVALRRGVELISRSQSRDGGWLYTPDSRGDEGSVTVTQIQALRGARNAGVHVPKKTIDRAIKYIERSQNPDGGISYSVRSRGSRPAISAAACAVLYNAGAYDSPMATKCFEYAWRMCQPTTSRGGHYFYTQLYMSQAVWQKGDKYWNKYFPAIQKGLLRIQQGNGSWQGDGVGLAYGTAIGLLIFQIPYNHLPHLEPLGSVGPEKNQKTKEAGMDDRAAIERLKQAHDQIRKEISKVIIGQDDVVDELLLAIFARGHCILEGVPGLAKSLLVHTLAQTLNLSFNRIQFTPDLMPADITGTEVIQEDKATGMRAFKFMQGPIFANVILADEINRTPPKTQAALLEAMQERQVTVGGERHGLPDPFFVLATQNPIEQEGTYPLPEAQQDRFMFKIKVTYPTWDEEREVVKTTTSDTEAKVDAVLSGEEMLACQKAVRRVPAADHVVEYAMRLVRATRVGEPGIADFVKENVAWGAGPRACQYLVLGAKARSALGGRTAATCADIQSVAGPVLRHRILTNFAAESAGITADSIIEQILEATPDKDVGAAGGAEATSVLKDA